MADQKEQPATRLGQRADPPFMVQPPGCWYTPDEVGRMLGNRVVQPHYAAWLVRKAIEAAALRARPEGYVLVPVEPTDEMCAAALARIKEVTVVIDAGPAKGATLVRDPYYHAYKAMLAARPQGVKDAG